MFLHFLFWRFSLFCFTLFLLLSVMHLGMVLLACVFSIAVELYQPLIGRYHTGPIG
jgi:multisubunit Na+/H+ antiporter MnhC subunit